MILLTDVNQSLNDTTKEYGLCDLTTDCMLVNLLELKYPGTSIRSLDRGTKTIVHILACGVNMLLVKKIGQLAFFGLASAQTIEVYIPMLMEKFY